MTLAQPIHLIDRSRVVAREECPRMRYLTYDFEGTGVESDSQALPLLAGIAIHSAHARLLMGESVDQVVTDVIGSYKVEMAARGLLGIDVTEALIREQSSLLEGMLRMWTKVRLPALLADYDVMSVEKAWRWTLTPGLQQSLRMDAILRRKDTGLIFILDFKTVSYPSEIWGEKFEHDHQTLLYVQAIEEEVGEPVGGIIYEGLVKGLFKKDTSFKSDWFNQKVQLSPYTMCYMAEEGEAGRTFQTPYTSKKAYRKVRPYDHMTMTEWVDYLIENEPSTVEQLFIIVPEILPPAAERIELKQQVIREELSYFDQLARYNAMEDGLEKDTFLDILAPKRRQRCFKYGLDNKCVFAASVCFNQGSHPLRDGGFRPRTPHHDTDLKVIA